MRSWQGCLGGGPRGLGPSSSEKTVCRGSPGKALKFGQVLVNVFRKKFARGREHSSDLMIERVFSNLFFVKHQNLFPQDSCILPIKPIKTLQINCYIFCMFFEAWWAVPYQRITEVRSPRLGSIFRGSTILLYKTHN